MSQQIQTQGTTPLLDRCRNRPGKDNLTYPRSPQEFLVRDRPQLAPLTHLWRGFVFNCDHAPKLRRRSPLIPQTGKQILTLLACVPDSGAPQSGTLTWSRWCHPRAVTGGTKFRCASCPFHLKKKGSSGDLVPVTGSACVSPRLSGPLFKAGSFGSLAACAQDGVRAFEVPRHLPAACRGSLEGGEGGPPFWESRGTGLAGAGSPREARERSARSAARVPGAGVLYPGPAPIPAAC